MEWMGKHSHQHYILTSHTAPTPSPGSHPVSRELLQSEPFPSCVPAVALFQKPICHQGGGFIVDEVPHCSTCFAFSFSVSICQPAARLLPHSALTLSVPLLSLTAGWQHKKRDSENTSESQGCKIDALDILYYVSWHIGRLSLGLLFL